jgi:protein gp37
MAGLTSIEWTEATWNPVTGCTKISAGCLNCYAQRMALRLQAMGSANYAAGFAVTTHPRMLDAPRHWRRPRSIFVNSMSDLFHEDVPDEFIIDVFDVMRATPWHRYQVLTKRSERLATVATALDWPSNVWAGVTVESGEYKGRIDDLRAVPAQVRFLSMEPLIGAAGALDLRDIDWVIVGGESGPGSRPMDPAWAADTRDQCAAARVPFFFKQWGGTRKKAAGRILDGRTWDEMPAASGA